MKVRHFILLALIWLLPGCSDIKPTSPESPVQARNPVPSHSPEAASTPLKKTEPELEIRIGGKEKTWTQSQLLNHPDLSSLTLMDHSAYEDQTKSYLAIPLARLFKGLEIADDKEIEYETLDGFSSTMNPSRLLNEEPGASVAYLAVEDPKEPWDKFKDRTYGPGPFYVVWVDPELSNIGREEWPFKLTGFRDRRSLEKRYPRLGPAPSIQPGSPVRKGYKLFIKNCFPCHAINGEGRATFGPDLNMPLSPTEYLKDGMIKQLVRNPQSLRTWKQGKMPAFPEDELSDEDIDLVVEFLKHKAETR